MAEILVPNAGIIALLDAGALSVIEVGSHFQHLESARRVEKWPERRWSATATVPIAMRYQQKERNDEAF